MGAQENAVSASQIDEKNLKHVKLDTYAVDYTLLQTDRAPIKVDFISLQKITDTYFKDYMIEAYKVSTQANLVDFKTSFVTAHFTYVYFQIALSPPVHPISFSKIFLIDVKI